MFNSFRLFDIFKNPRIGFQKNKIPLHLFFLLSSFFLGNLCGILTKNIDSQKLGLVLIIFFEFINTFYFKNREAKVITGAEHLRLTHGKFSIMFLYFNFLKRGFLIGIFIEAFKVGS